MKLQTLALFSLVSLAIGGAAWVFVYPILSGERKMERRRDNIARSEPAARTGRVQKSRREQVEESLKELEVGRRSTSVRRCPRASRKRA